MLNDMKEVGKYVHELEERIQYLEAQLATFKTCINCSNRTAEGACECCTHMSGWSRKETA